MVVLAFLMAGLLVPAVMGQNEPESAPGITNAAPALGNHQAAEVGVVSKFEFWLSVQVIGFGVFVLVLEYRLMMRGKYTASEILRILAVTLILVGSLFVVTAGFDSIQIGPIMGLFGTVAGYLLGRGAAIESQGNHAQDKGGLQ